MSRHVMNFTIILLSIGWAVFSYNVFGFEATVIGLLVAIYVDTMLIKKDE